MTARAPLRIAFTHIPRQVWAGGYNYLSNLFAALGRFREGEFAPVVFAGNRDDESDLAALAAIPGVEIVRSAAFEGGAGLTAALALGVDSGAVREFRDAADRPCLRERPFFWLASALSGGGVVSRFSASQAAAAFPGCRTLEARGRLSLSNRIGADHHGQQ